MGADDAGLSPSQRIRLEQLAADFVAEGIDGDGMVQLASQPPDWKVIDGHEIEALCRTALAEVGLEPPSREASAASVIERVVPPVEGALRLWNLWDECGRAGELASMLQLHDAWESSVWPDRAAVEAEILAYAPEVITAADRILTAHAVGRQNP